LQTLAARLERESRNVMLPRKATGRVCRQLTTFAES
jgi:hypothetical protein